MGLSLIRRLLLAAEEHPFLGLLWRSFAIGSLGLTLKPAAKLALTPIDDRAIDTSWNAMPAGHSALFVRLRSSTEIVGLAGFRADWAHLRRATTEYPSGNVVSCERKAIQQ